MSECPDPAAAITMTQVRAGVDEIDRRLAALIALRFRYMEAAARVKPTRAEVRDEVRKAEVIANARANADASGYSPDVAAALWDVLVEASISYEFDRFDAR